MEANNDANRTYEEIEPYCKWRKDEAIDILEIHLQGFKKEHLRVQLNNFGVLVVTGECPVDQTKGAKFRKEIKVSENCKRSEIRAKLTGSVLYITMPKISSLSNTTRTQNQPDKQNQIQHVDDNQKPNKLEEKVSGGNRDSDGAVRMGRAMEYLKRPVFTWTQMGGKTALKLGALAAVVVVVSVGAYVAYKYRKSFHVDN
ncbi:hypothetical protein Dsin_021543 [Dipteronia sinensis]|uniref:SHSP domain-containing protein n=1 Tax=Dipteronia sinensis TaxID=43782 RepID=A0AAE0DYX4_9ROSI|nr:hypothetical protein Dsin_021543 [Dipteronia sinensis]